MRKGFTLAELLISLTVLTVVLTLAAGFAAEQLRFFRWIGDLIAVRSQLGQAAQIAHNSLWGVAPRVGDLLVAQDSAVEIRMPIGLAMLCDALPGTITIPQPGQTGGNTISSFVRSPEPGDRVSALVSDSLGATWLHLRVSTAAQPGLGCPIFPNAGPTWQIGIDELVALSPGMPLRFTRPLRLSLYRSSDNRWYLGARDWNGPLQQLNGIQPVAGPFEPYGDSTSGLRFDYFDVRGVPLTQPVDPSRVASLTLTARAATRRPVRIRGMQGGVVGDSALVVIRLRNTW